MSAVRKTVLVVDDDPMIAKSIKRVLEKDYIVTTAADAKEALQKLQEESFDLVYTDIKMPGMSGIELAEQVQAKQPWTPVVIITGFGTQESERRAEAAGVSDFLHKPLTPEMIQQSARTARPRPVLTVIDGGLAQAAPVIAPTPVQEREYSRMMSIALFLASPFIGLLYAIAMPLVGLAMLAYLGYTAFAKTAAFTTMKNVSLFIASPFIGLAYAVALPFLGLGMMAWVGGKALIGTPQKD